MNIESIPKKSKLIYIAPLDDEFYVMHSAISNEVITTDKGPKEILDLVDGSRSIKDIASHLNTEASKVLANVNSLKDLGFLYSEEDAISTKGNALEEIYAWLHITNACNLDCGYCYIDKDSCDSMSMELAKKSIDALLESCRANKTPRLEIKLTGGEPLLKFNLVKEIVKYARISRGNIKVSFTLLTNATLLDKDMILYLKNNGIRVGISLDGIDEDNEVRHYSNGDNSFKDVVKGIKLLKDTGVEFSVSTTISSSNYKNLPKLTTFFLEKEYPFRFSLEKNILSGSPGLLNHLDDLIAVLNVCYDIIEEKLPKDFILDIHTFGDISFGEPKPRACGAGDYFMAIGHDGKIGDCGLGLSNPFGTLGAYDTDLLSFVRQKNEGLCKSAAKEYEGCSACQWQTCCAGGCPQQTMSTFICHDKPSIYCRVYKAVVPRILKIAGLQIMLEEDE